MKISILDLVEMGGLSSNSNSNSNSISISTSISTSISISSSILIPIHPINRAGCAIEFEFKFEFDSPNVSYFKVRIDLKRVLGGINGCFESYFYIRWGVVRLNF